MDVPAHPKLIRQDAKAGPKQSKYWCFTVNNPSVYEMDVIFKTDALFRESKATYLVVGKEIGEECKTPHLQGYIEFPSVKRLNGVKSITVKYDDGDIEFEFAPLTRAHLEVRMGTGDQASAYCKKDGDFVEYGVISNPNQVLPDTQPYDE